MQNHRALGVTALYNNFTFSSDHELLTAFGAVQSLTDVKIDINLTSVGHFLKKVIICQCFIFYFLCPAIVNYAAHVCHL